MYKSIAISLGLALSLATTVFAADKADVKAKWHTPYDLYLTPKEAYDMKFKEADKVLFLDVRTRAEAKYIGMADQVDFNIPIRTLDTDYNWSKKSKTYRTKLNKTFVANIQKALKIKGLDKQTPIILMCQSGSRVPKAAKLLHEAGFSAVYTQYQGFEGIKAKAGDKKGQRVVNGWKNANLPWSYKLDENKMFFKVTD